MKKTPIIFEVFVNKFLGSSYYKNNSFPRIEKNKKSWSLKHKETYFMLSFDIDEKKDIDNLPLLLRILKKKKIKASFAVIGKHVEKYPDIYRQIIKEGHELINHTYTHPDNPEFNPKKNFHKISGRERYEEILKCHEVVKKLLDYEMKGFRTPHFGYQYTDDLHRILKKLNYAYSSSTVAVRTKTAGFPYSKAGVWEFPVTCCPKHPFCIFDTSHAFRAKFVSHTPEEYLETFQALLKDSRKTSFINIYQDPQDIRLFDYERFLDMLKSHDLKIITYAQLVKLLEK